MADEFIRVFPNKNVVPINQVVKASKYSEDDSGGGGGFASMLENEFTRKKEKDSKEGTKAPKERLKRMEGMNQYDARANAFFYRLAHTADYRA